VRFERQPASAPVAQLVEHASNASCVFVVGRWSAAIHTPAMDSHNEHYELSPSNVVVTGPRS
jgi:hypothetical protein